MDKPTQLLGALLFAGASLTANAANWTEIEQQAKGQTLYFNAWGGSERINDYIQWAAAEVKARYDIQLEHVKISDAAEVVSRILAEKTAGREQQGSVDLLWVNGENFKALKEQGLLFGPFAEGLPNYRYVNPATTAYDFAIPVEGMEAAWGMAQLVFIADSAKVSDFPRSMPALLDFAQQHPGRVSYPQPPSFHGSTFLKQALTELTPDPSVLLQPVEQSDFARVTAPLWQYLDQLHPVLWREGKSFPASAEAMRQLLDDGELLISLSFNPNEASAAIIAGQLAPTVKTYIHQGGTIGNTHYLAIPFNSSNKAAAQVLVNFLQSPEAQARKADPAVWGDPSVLALERLSAEDQARWQAIDLGPAALDAADLGRTLAEPHASWMPALEQAWQERYGR
ncbi:ABC transporter substrate-binding protein [Balneatrix alpica]|uniref:ABC transporter substrate-binding protein n=1 Tax=Balneatrix alpica TaxID=75684 RepID=A0ABV5ZBA0_9GAMM|nr:ABC transporter substrate-binding protein [Balneatrix alpica]